MSIKLRPDHERRFLDAVRAGGFESADDAMDTARELLRSQTARVVEDRAAIDA